MRLIKPIYAASTFAISIAMISWSNAALAADTPTAQNGVGAQAAQTEGTPPAPSGTEDTGLGDIVVTAQKRSETLQRVPAAVTAIGSAELAARGISDLRDMRGLVPSVSFAPAFLVTKIFIRGVGQEADGEFNDPAVSMNIDGVYTPRFTSAGSLFDVERVEVLPGPQGTLYGRNSAGGTVNVTTKLPGKELGGEGIFEYGNYNRVRAFAAVDLPVTEQFALRAAVDANYRKGYTSNNLNGQDSFAARLTARYLSDGGHSLIVRGEFQHAGGGGDSVILRPLPFPNDPWFQSKIDGEHFFTDRTAYRLSAELSVVLGGPQNVTLTYIPGYIHYDMTYRLMQGQAFRYYPDPGAVGNPLTGFAAAFEQLGDKADQLTNELRLSGDSDRLNWVVGLYAFRHLARGPGGSFDIYNPVVFTGGSFQPYAVQTGGNASKFRVITHSKAAFGQLTFSLTDHLRLTGGLRYSSDDRHAVGTAQASSPIANIVRPALNYDLGLSDNRIDWKVGAELDVGPNSLAYANVSTGYIGGGFNVSATIQTARVFAPEELTAYTVGLKNTFASGRLKLNVEGFYYDFRDLQVAAINALTGSSVIQNVPKSEIYGIQIDGAFRLARNTTISGNLGYLHASVREGLLGPQAVYACAPGSSIPQQYCAAGNVINYAGKRLPYSPTWSGTVSVSQRFDMTSGGNVEALAAVNFQSKTYYALTNQLGTDDEGFAKLDASLTYNAPDDRWSIGIWGKNLTNHASYSTLGFTAAYGLQTWIIAPPRTYGARLSFKY